MSLVESLRIDGKPKQKHIAVLGNIFEGENNFEEMRTKLKVLKIGKPLIEKLMSQIEKI